MRRLRTALRWLDAWGVLLLGVLVALGVIILLATPGPWQRGPDEAPPVRLAPAPPEDVAVFVLGGTGRRCTGAMWLHADHEHGTLTASLLPSPIQGRVDGGGYAPVDRLVTDLDAERASTALGAALGVDMDAWAVLDRQALRIAVPAMFPMGELAAQRREFRRATSAWAGEGGAALAWRRQYETLAAALPRVAFDELNIVGFSNYVLGFGHVSTDLDLRGAGSLAKLLQGLTPAKVRVRAVPTVLQRCGEARAWRVDEAGAAQLRASLAFGLLPPSSLPVARDAQVEATVVVAGAPGGSAGRAYLREIRARLRVSAGVPVRVEPLRVPAGSSLAEAVGRRLDEGRPLAVLVAAALAPPERPAADIAADITAVAEVLDKRAQPGLVLAPALPRAQEDPATAAARAECGLPVAPPAPVLATSTATPIWDAASARLTARANAATLVRACWPAALAPRLASTHIRFPFAAAAATQVAVIGLDGEPAQRLVARLRTYGFVPSAVGASGWEAPLAVSAVYYRAGGRRPAIVLADDLALSRALAVAAPAAPAAVTLNVVK